MIIHQIFFKVSDKTFDDFPIYSTGKQAWEDFCKDHGWEYRLHTECDTSLMTDEEINIMKQGTKRYPFFAVDYYRLILLSYYGGMYVDLDVLPTDKFTEIMNEDILIGRSIDKGDDKFYANNNLIKLSIPVAIKLKEYAHTQYYEKMSMEVYKTRMIRFFLHTVSACMLSRFCKKNNIPFLKEFHIYFMDYNTQAWDNPALKNSLKNKSPKYNKMIKIDDNVLITGGKSNKCEGIVCDLKNVFCLVRITKDKKGKSVFGDKSIKVKKTYLEVIEPPPIEMPTQEDLVVVDKNIFDTIDENIAASPFLPQSQDIITSTIEEVHEETGESNPNLVYQEDAKVLAENKSILINENNVSCPAPTIDDALNWKRDNEKLNLQLESMMSFQGNACAEIAELQMVIKELKEQLSDSCRLEKIEELKHLINNI